MTWRCFHCDEVFTDEASAALHFGTSERQSPACSIDIAEYRRMEEIHRRHCEEDTDLHRQLYSAQGDKQRAFVRGEEAGYAHGIRDTVDAVRKAKAEYNRNIDRGNVHISTGELVLAELIRFKQYVENACGVT